MTPGAQRVRLNALPPWQRRVVVASAVSLLVSGLAWLPFHYLWGPGAGELPHPLEPWLLRCHGLAATAGLFAAGVVASSHVGRGWRLVQRRATGIGVCLVGSLVIVSGYGLAYLVPEAWHSAVGWFHSIFGVGAFALGVAHRRYTREQRRANDVCLTREPAQHLRAERFDGRQ